MYNHFRLNCSNVDFSGNESRAKKAKKQPIKAVSLTVSFVVVLEPSKSSDR